MTDRIPTTAMILAAGLGTRLQPLTDHLPKPLLPLGGRPLLESIITSLQGAGCHDFVINTHHLPQQINDYLDRREDRKNFQVLHEPEILGTGGALVGAAEFLSRAGTFILHNGDVLSDAPLAELVAEHRRSRALVTLLLVDHVDVNSVALDAEMRMLGVGTAEAYPDARMLTYTGVAVIDGEFLDFLPPVPCSLVTGLTAAVAANPDHVRGFTPRMNWSDLGTMERYQAAHRDLIGRDGDQGPLMLLPQAADALLRGIGFQTALYGRPLAAQASARVFCRVQDNARSCVLMQDADLDTCRRFLAVARFLYTADLGGPEVLAEDTQQGLVLLEDLGGVSLYDAPTPVNYRHVLDALIKLQMADAAACPEAGQRIFGRETLLWETSYFREWFLQRDCGLDDDRLAGLEEEFIALADVVLQQPTTLMHRDFQSMNILLQAQRVRLIDFQDLQRGPVAYDLMSLLRDPYHRLDAELRRELVAYYHARLQAAGGPSITLEELRRHAALAGLQRNMQALGAYARLSLDKGKLFFRQYIPAGLAHLREGLADVNEMDYLVGGMPRLTSLIDDIDVQGDRHGPDRILQP
jgi:aminoglycoside/choline kinase family phosphotransferase/choline kinase